MNLPQSPRLFTLSDETGFSLQIMDIGATWLSCQVPVDGARREVLLGRPRPEDHPAQPGYLGAVVGRYANRIAGARFELNGRTHLLERNEGANQLHGGPDGFDRRRWREVSCDARHVRLGLASPPGDQGFPGALRAQVEYRIATPRQVSITFVTEVDAPCPVNLSSHAYFNLDAQHETVHAHRVRVAADHFLPVDDGLIPTGELAPVHGTAFDLNGSCVIGERLNGHPQLALAGGYDHCYALRAACKAPGEAAAEVWSADGRLGLSMSTSYPGLQVYTGNQLAGTPGRDGAPYRAHAGIALEPQYFPDSPNRTAWPQPTQQPGNPRRHAITYQFLQGAGE